MNVTAIKNQLRRFIKRYNTQFDNMGKRQSQLLELSALVIATQHYRKSGYQIVAKNLRAGEFRVKTGAPGKPFNFSWFEAKKNDDVIIEIHANFPIKSYYTLDNGIYVVDVGVIKAGHLPQTKRDKKDWKAMENDKLLTFIEAKKLVIYPMLLAQFIGIVHEIKPNFLGGRRPNGFLRDHHFDPALVSVGYVHGTSASIIDGYDRRGFKINIVPNFDVEVAKLRGDSSYQSPLAAK